MFNTNKITEFFCTVDDLCIESNTKNTKKGKGYQCIAHRKRYTTISYCEAMTILVSILN